MSKGARDFGPSSFHSVDELNIHKLTSEYLLLPVYKPSDIGMDGKPLFQKGQIIRVMLPNNYVKGGCLIELLEVTETKFTFQVKDTREVLIAQAIMIVPEKDHETRFRKKHRI